LVFVIGVLSLVDHAKAIGLLHEGPLVGFTEQPVGAEQGIVNTGATVVRAAGKNGM